jgi:Cytochrome c554 and c-prime
MSGQSNPAAVPAVRAAVVALIAVGMTVAAGLLLVHWLAPAAPAAPPFPGWPTDKKPDLILMLSGQEHGYLQPCGCSSPQLGGLARRYNFLQNLRGRGWPVVAVDLGDLLDPPEHRGPQTLLKYKKSMEALKLMNYLGVAIGPYETSAPTLLDVLAEVAINEPDPPVLFSNLMNKQNNFTNAVQSYTVSGGQNGAPKVGVAAIMGPTVFKKEVPKQNPAVQVEKTALVLRDALQAMQAQKPELRLLLYQGTADEAKACASHFPEFQVVLRSTQESEPPAKPDRAGGSMIVSVGHKGRYVGVVGVYRTTNPQKPFDFYYALVALGEEFETPKDEKPNPIMLLMEDYAKEVKAGNFLARYPERKHGVQVDFPNAEYVGSQKCKKCHEAAFKVWEKTPHHHAYDELVNATRPSNRQFDGECIQCHVVGFGNATGFKDEQTSKHLKHVGCESCHGPGSLHVADTLRGDQKEHLLALMNPYRPQPNETQKEMNKRLNLLDQESCQKCHDIDNDVHWDFRKKWPLIVHPEKGGAPRGKDPFLVPGANQAPAGPAANQAPAAKK